MGHLFHHHPVNPGSPPSILPRPWLTDCCCCLSFPPNALKPGRKGEKLTVRILFHSSLKTHLLSSAVKVRLLSHVQGMRTVHKCWFWLLKFLWLFLDFFHGAGSGGRRRKSTWPSSVKRANLLNILSIGILSPAFCRLLAINPGMTHQCLELRGARDTLTLSVLLHPFPFCLVFGVGCCPSTAAPCSTSHSFPCARNLLRPLNIYQAATIPSLFCVPVIIFKCDTFSHLLSGLYRLLWTSHLASTFLLKWTSLSLMSWLKSTWPAS